MSKNVFNFSTHAPDLSVLISWIVSKQGITPASHTCFRQLWWNIKQSLTFIITKTAAVRKNACGVLSKKELNIKLY